MLAWLDAVAPDEGSVGGKAAGLARALRAGLPVPRGLVVPADRAGRMDAALADELRRATAGAGPWIVRSSATVEDTAGHAAPGIFRTVRDVDAAGVPAAVEAVWSSIDSPAAAAYLEARGLERSSVGMAVLVQEQVSGVLGTARSRPPGGGVLLERDERLALVEGGDLRGDLDLDPDVLREIAAAAARLDVLLGGAVDVEWVAGARLWIVQARRAPDPPPWRAPVSADELAAALAFSRAEPAAVWTWDATHNPEPLSPAQAGLVELVDSAGAAGVRQRVVLGYLYTTPAGAPPTDRIVPAGDLARVFVDEIRPAFERELARMGDDLEATLDAYLAFYRRYSRELAPSLAAAQRVELPRATVVLDDVAPVWDVAAPTYAEQGQPVSAGLAALGDTDDVFFARAQAGVRRALLAVARRAGIAPDDVFFLPLDDVRRAARIGAAPAGAAETAARLRERHRRLLAFAPPLSISDGAGLARPPHGREVTLRGRGIGGQVRGLVHRLDALHATPPPAGRVLVVATVLPTMAPVLRGAAAIIAEHGGLLGHGASLARELGIPCVVTCVGALTALAQGDEVWVDADAGIVVRLRAG